MEYKLASPNSYHGKVKHIKSHNWVSNINLLRVAETWKGSSRLQAIIKAYEPYISFITFIIRNIISILNLGSKLPRSKLHNVAETCKA